MGCGVSKLEAEEEAPAAGLPAAPRRRLIHRRRNVRLRKDSIISTTELLRIDESEAGDDAASQDLTSAIMLPVVAEDATKISDADDDERRRIGFGAGRRVGPDEEELPGSPSFRFYFEVPRQDAARNEDASFNPDGKIEKTKGEDNSHGLKEVTESLNFIKDDKSMKKDKGGRFKVLTKGPCAVYGLLNGRNSSGDHHHQSPASSRVSHDLLGERCA